MSIVRVAGFFLLSRCNMRLCLRSGDIYHECSRTGTTTNDRASYYIYNTMCSLCLLICRSLSQCGKRESVKPCRTAVLLNRFLAKLSADFSRIVVLNFLKQIRVFSFLILRIVAKPCTLFKCYIII